MKHCVICTTDKEDVSVVQVAPATWSGHHDFVQVCAQCLTSRQFQLWAKRKKPQAGVPTPAAAPNAAEQAKTDSTGTRSPKTVQIAHRRTGALLHEVESPSLERVSLSGAALSGAALQHAVLRGTDLHQADLRLADLSGADLRGADLRGVNLRGADLRGTDLREARMNRADLSHARYDAGTQWPTGFDQQACGALKEVRSG